MPMIRSEFSRLLWNLKYFLCLIGFVLLLTYLHSVGLSECQKIKAIEKKIEQAETKNPEKYLTYENFGGYGFRVSLSSSPILSLFCDRQPPQRTESVVNTLENSRILNVSDGRTIFKDGVFKDFSGAIYVLGSLLMILMGMSGFNNDKYVKNVLRMRLFGVIATRFAVPIALFILSLSIAYIRLASVSGPLENAVSKAFVAFSGYSILFLLFFYSIGVTVFTLSKSRREFKIIVSLIAWGLFVFVLPEYNNLKSQKKSEALPAVQEHIDLKKQILLGHEKMIRNAVMPLLKEGKNAEAFKVQKRLVEEYLNNDYKKVQALERAYIDDTNKIIDENESRLFFVPTVAFLNLSRECSGLGRRGYLDFLSHVSSLNKDFLRFITTKRYSSKDKTLEPFLKNDENIFRAKPQIPTTYWASLVTTLLLSIGLLAGSIITLKRRLKKGETEEPDYEIIPGKFNYIWCHEKNSREKLFTYYQDQPDTTCIDNVDGKDIDPGIPLKHTLKYFCDKFGSRSDLAQGHLEKLGVTFPISLKTAEDKEKARAEIIKKIYLAAKLAEDKPTTVLNDFIYGEHDEFEEGFLDVLEAELAMNKTIIYLSPRVFKTKGIKSLKSIKGLNGTPKGKFTRLDAPVPFDIILR